MTSNKSVDSLRVASVELRAGDIQCDRYHGAAISCVALARLDVFAQDIQSEAGVLSTKEGERNVYR